MEIYLDVPSLYERASPAVVQIRRVQAVKSQEVLSTPAIGSGFLIDHEGHMVTNNHVVGGANRLAVAFSDSEIVLADVVGQSAENDLALLKVDAKAVRGIVPLPLGNSSALKPGQPVLVMGNPFGLTDSITLGIISGLNRSVTVGMQYPLSGLIQTDADLSPGNSGGPLLNDQGEVIGINTAVASMGTGAINGIGFSVPVNALKSLLQQLSISLPRRTPFLGISGITLTPQLTESGALSVDRGVYVTAIMPGSPAENSGLIAAKQDSLGKPVAGGDVITGVDGQEVDSIEGMIALIANKKQGEVTGLSVMRNRQSLIITVVLG